jgi:hypothetical protein
LGRIAGIQAIGRSLSMIGIDHVAAVVAPQTGAKSLCATGGSDVSSTIPGPDAPPQAEPPAEPARTSFVEAVLDSLPAWTVIAAAIAFLYLVWMTIEILGRYFASIPGVTP